MSESKSSNINFMNKDVAEYVAFYAKIKSLAHKKGAHCLEAAKGIAITDADAKAKANTDLYYLLIEHIGNQDLINTLESDYDEQGTKALQYIEGLHKTGTNEAKLEKASSDYKKLVLSLCFIKSAEEFRSTTNKMQSIRKELNGMEREISKATFLLFYSHEDCHEC